MIQGTLESLTGCIRVITSFASLDSNSKRFMSSLMNHKSTESDKSCLSMIDSIVCECKFMHEEKIIRCKPCGLNGNATDPNLVTCCQSIGRLAKKYGITSGYWEDMFYLTLDTAVPNRELLCSLLNEKYSAKLLSSSVCDRHSTFEEKSITLVERWNLPDSTLLLS